MPRATFPPTPEASTEIFGKDGDVVIPDESTFALPPSAIGSRHISSASSTSSKASDSSYVPNSPSFRSHKDAAAAASNRRKASIAAAAAVSAAAKDDFALPPPPTRKRKIIQMHPSGDGPSHAPAASAGTKSDSNLSAPPTTTTSTAGTKRKASGTSAGRKVARKTAHSLIERRRRSKMNEEFAVLKNMIPACAGQEMHKLAILQASTEYLRYLEQCILDLKANSSKSAQTSARSTPFSHHARTRSPTADDNHNHNPNHNRGLSRLDDSSSEDEAMDDNDDDDDSSITASAPQSTLRTTQSHSTYNSPSIYPTYTSTSTSTSISTTINQQTYPATPPTSGNASANAGRVPTEFTFSPLPPATAIPMQPPAPSPAGVAVAAGFEEEASAALLMLNKYDRRVSAASSASGASPLFGPSVYTAAHSPAFLPMTAASSVVASARTSPVLSAQGQEYGQGQDQGRRGMSVRDLLSH